MESKSLYDPLIIEAYTKALYQQADAMVTRAKVLSVLLGFLLTVLVWGGASFEADKRGEEVLWPAALILGSLSTLVIHLVWVGAAERRGFALKLQAQTALCQLQIEKNTRPDGRIT